jgi:excisionase family DNA binding protein
MIGNEPNSEYLTIEQLAMLLQVSPKSVSRWASTDLSMPVLRIGRTVRFPKERVLRWLRAREQGVGRARQSEKLLPPHTQPIDGQGKPSNELRICAHS